MPPSAHTWTALALALVCACGPEVRETRYAEGTLWSRVEYAGGAAHGRVETRHPNGHLRSRGSYREGLEHGPWEFDYADGTPRLRCSYNRGHLEGAWTAYYPSGELESRGAWSRGVRSGDWTFYMDDGRPWVERRFEPGLGKTREVIWWREPELRIEFDIDPDGRELRVRSFRSDGTALAGGLLRDGLREGTWREWHDGGGLRGECEWRAGAKCGEERRWFADGTPQALAAFRAGELHGPFRSWHPDGTSHQSGEFIDGQRSGPWEFHDAQGRLEPERSGRYEAGRRLGD